MRIKRENYRGVEVIRVPIIPRGRNSKIKLILNYLSFAFVATLLAPFLLPKQIDAILVYQMSPVFIGIPALLAKRLRRAPVFFWIQDLWPESLVAVNAIKSRPALAMVRAVVRFLYRHSDVILVQSRAFIPRVKAIYPQASDIRYLPNPADRAFVPLSPPVDASERSLMEPGFRVMYAGNIGVAQDLETVLAAAELLKDCSDVRWVLLGDGVARRSLESQVEERGIGRVVQLLGPYPPERIPTFLALADVLFASLRPSDIFALTVPQKVQAYLACGKPILVAIEGEAARLIEDAGAGFGVAPGDPAALAARVLELRAMAPSQRAAMGRAGRRYFEREFDRDILLARLTSWMASASAERIGEK